MDHTDPPLEMKNYFPSPRRAPGRQSRNKKAQRSVHARVDILYKTGKPTRRLIY